MHKHLQLIPYETMNCGEYIPVEESALNYIKEKQITDEFFSID